jgi:mannitol-1-/sugar-/sorbitol-6-/2-deoxyglucose-6-phosphatase
MIQAVIFDMDGLLIDSEPLWVQSEISIFNDVGVPLTAKLAKQTMGMRADEVVNYWHHKYPWKKPSQRDVETKLLDTMVERLQESDIVLPGVHKVTDIFMDAGLPMAIASSSPHRVINAAIKKLGIKEKIDVIHSAEHEGFGKPHPAVYIATAKMLKVQPENCLAFEDSPNGVIAAKAAKMKCIAVPDTSMRSHAAIGIADIILDSLESFSAEMITRLA